jgi:hypothetical protein
MGGIGSSCAYGDRFRANLNDMDCLDVRHLHRAGYLSSQIMGPIGPVCVWMDHGQVVVSWPAWAGEQRLSLAWTPCYYDGMRPWFRCPACQRRVAVLYAPPGRHFCCRHCRHPPYASANESRERRLLRKRQKLLARLGVKDEEAMPPVLEKPKGMHARTWRMLLRQALDVTHALEAAEAQREAADTARATATLGRLWARFQRLRDRAAMPPATLTH